jgi:ribosomal protein S2
MEPGSIGHQTHNWNPKMRQFIFASAPAHLITDLRRRYGSRTARELLRAVVRGEGVLFVCAKSSSSSLRPRHGGLGFGLPSA